MITNKDIRVENGFLIINGDKYPLDGQSPEAIMEIVEDNSDTTPTENSTAPITSGGVYTALAGKEDTLTFDTTPTAESANPVTSAGIKTYVDTALEGIKALIPVVTDSTISSETSYDMGSNNGLYLLVIGQGGGADLQGLYLVKITHYAGGTNVATIVTPTQNTPTVVATEIKTNEGGKITITPAGVGFHVAIYEINMNMS